MMKFQPKDRVIIAGEHGARIVGTVIGNGTLDSSKRARFASPGIHVIYAVELDEKYQGMHEASGTFVSTLLTDEAALEHAVCEDCNCHKDTVADYDGHLLCDPCLMVTDQ